jgi:hypothetical protein
MPRQQRSRGARTHALTILVAAGTTCLAAEAAVADVVPVGQIPATSLTAEGFAPPGWRVEKRVGADLDGIAPKDVAIVLIQSGSGGSYGAADGSRALILARGQTSGGFRRAGLAPRLLGCAQCGGAFWGALSMPVTVRATGRVLVVKQTFGSRQITETTHRIGWRTTTAKFRLIGLDTKVTDRATGRSTEVSTNYLTRRQITTKRRGSRVVSKTTRAVTLQPRPIAGLAFGSTRP